MARYQQGIGIPETLGVQPTVWEDPKLPTIKRATWKVGNTGAQRNYGSTPRYVDTVPHRWTTPQGPGIIESFLGVRGGMQRRQQQRQRQQAIANAPGPYLSTYQATVQQGQRVQARTTAMQGAQQAQRMYDQMYQSPEEQRQQQNNVRQWRQAVKSSDDPFNRKAEAEPTDQETAPLITGVDPFGSMPENAPAIKFMRDIREASDKPLPNTTEWKGDEDFGIRASSRPIGFTQEEEGLANWLQQPVTAPPKTRTQKRPRTSGPIQP